MVIKQSLTFSASNRITLFAREGLWISPTALKDQCEKAKVEEQAEDSNVADTTNQIVQRKSIGNPCHTDDKENEDFINSIDGRDEVIQALEQNQHHYTAGQRARFQDEPETLLSFRKEAEMEMAKMFPSSLKDSQEAFESRQYLTAYMERMIGSSHQKLGGLIPKWTPGCRRTSVREALTTLYRNIG
jgi:hypothetical protein